MLYVFYEDRTTSQEMYQNLVTYYIDRGDITQAQADTGLAWETPLYSAAGQQSTIRVYENGKAAHMDLKPYVVKVNLSVDVNRDCEIDDRDEVRSDTNGDGKITSADEEAEGQFSKEYGAVILVNNDRDNGTATPDNENDVIDSNGDSDDLAVIAISRCGLTSLPFRVVLRIEDDTIVKIFDGTSPGNTKILPLAAGGKTCEIPAAWVTGTGGAKTIAAEALKYIGQADFDGKIRVSLVYQQDSGEMWTDIFSDTVVLQVAPVLFAWNGQKATNIWVGERTSYNDICRNVISATVSLRPAGWLGLDAFVQDQAEIGNVQGYYGGPDGPTVVVDLVGGEPTWAKSLSDGMRYGYYKSEYDVVDGVGAGGGGDVETTAPLRDYPLGRVFMGTAAGFLEFGKFAARQKVQVRPNRTLNGPIRLNTEWLVVGHVDEMVCFVPRGDSYAILVASPRAAVDVLHDLWLRGDGMKYLLIGNRKVGQIALPVQSVLISRFGSKYSTTTSVLLQTDVGAVSGLEVAVACFDNGDVLRLHDEYVEVTAGGGTTTLQVKRAVIDGTLPKYAPAGHGIGSKVYALSTYMLDNVRSSPIANEQQKCAQEHVDDVVQRLTDLLVESGETNVEIVPLPVLFSRHEYDDGGVRFLAMTSNVVNALVVPQEGKILMAKLHGLTTIFGEMGCMEDFHVEIRKRLQDSGVSVGAVFVESWSLHMKDGEVHCGTNARRDPASQPWWLAWPKDQL